MTVARCADQDFVSLYETHGPHETARRLKVHVRNVYARRLSLESKLRRPIKTPDVRNTRLAKEHPQRHHLDIQDGVVLVCSDAHYWPGEQATTAHRAFVQFCKTMKPAAVIVNGDAFDGARISRHPSIGWEKSPDVVSELAEVQGRLSEIEDAAPKADLIWPLGNHDGRFESRLATVAPEFARVHGFHLKDHMGDRWKPCWSCWVNENTVVKHRYSGGTHAAFNNAMKSGKHLVTGHLHRGTVTPFTDYNGTRYGVDLPCIAEPFGPQFTDYTEDNPRNQRSGFAVLTYYRGRLLQPELVFVADSEHVEFRGAVIKC